LAAFEIVVQTMADMGFRLFLPWLLILSVTYGLLEKYQVVSDETQVNGSVALAVAFLAIIGVNRFAPVGIFANFAAAITFGVFGILGFMVLVAMSGYDIGNYADGGTPRYFAVTIFVVSFVTVIVTYIDVSSVIGETQNVFENVILPILILIFFILVVQQTTKS